jgi:hypothetical protein
MIADAAIGQTKPVQLIQAQCVTDNPASADRLPSASAEFKIDRNFVVTLEIFK